MAVQATLPLPICLLLLSMLEHPEKLCCSSLPRQAYLILSSSVSAKSSSILIKFSRCVDLWS